VERIDITAVLLGAMLHIHAELPAPTKMNVQKAPIASQTPHADTYHHPNYPLHQQHHLPNSVERPWKQPQKIAGSPVPVEIRIVALDYLASIPVQWELAMGIIRVPSIFIVGGAGVMLHILVKLLVLAVQMMSVPMDIIVTLTLPAIHILRCHQHFLQLQTPRLQ